MWYLVMSRSLAEKEADKQRNYEAHRQWLDDQHRAGRLLSRADHRRRLRHLCHAGIEPGRSQGLAAKTRTTLAASAKWKFWNGAPIAPFSGRPDHRRAGTGGEAKVKRGHLCS